MADRDDALWDDLVERGHLIVETIAEGVFRISESVLELSARSYFYLVRGTDSACLIDGGWGLCADVRAFLPMNGRRLIAAATHSHYDHIGILHAASERMGHPLEAAVFADPRPEATQALPFLVDLPVLPGGGCIDATSISQVPCPLTSFVEEGDRIGLGGNRHLLVLHTPGHSKGSLSFLDSGSETLFCGDVLLEGDIYDDIPGADRTALLRTHQRLASLPFRRLCAGHGRILDRRAAVVRIERYRQDHHSGQ